MLQWLDLLKQWLLLPGDLVSVSASFHSPDETISTRNAALWKWTFLQWCNFTETRQTDRDDDDDDGSDIIIVIIIRHREEQHTEEDGNQPVSTQMRHASPHSNENNLFINKLHHSIKSWTQTAMQTRSSSGVRYTKKMKTTKIQKQKESNGTILQNKLKKIARSHKMQ